MPVRPGLGLPMAPLSVQLQQRRPGREGSRSGVGSCPARALALGGVMAFFVGLVLFIGLCGYLDARLPWPSLRWRQR